MEGKKKVNLNVTKRLGLKIYNRQFIIGMKYVRSKQILHQYVKDILIELQIFVNYNSKRGSRGGKNKIIANNDKRIKSVQTVRKYFPANFGKRKNGIRDINHCNLNRIQLLKDFYSYPDMLYANVRSCYNKFDQIQALMLTKKPDIAIFTETWIKQNDVDAFNIQNYTAFHRNRNRIDKNRGGGVGLYIKKSITVLEVKLPEEEEIEAITLKFRPSLLPRSISWYAIIAFYFPPDKFGEFSLIEFLTCEIDRLLTNNSKANIFVIGDYNELDESFLYCLPNFKQIITVPTRGESRLDRCFTNNIYPIEVISLPPIGLSDHITLWLKPIQQKELIKGKKKVTMIRKKNKSCFVSVRKVLEEVDWTNFCLIDDINMAADLFNEFIYEIYIICFPSSVVMLAENQPEWINANIIKLLNKRDKAFNNHEMNVVSDIEKVLKNVIRNSKKTWLSKKLKGVKFASSEFYGLIKDVVGINKQFVFKSFVEKTEEESFTIISEFFSRIANKGEPIKKETINGLSTVSRIPRIEYKFVLDQLLKVNPRSACGPDGIPSFIYSDFADLLVEPISSLINLSIEKGTCPNQWKRAYLTLIPKINNPGGPHQMRPISISSHVAKICERHIMRNLLLSIESKLDPMQFGGLPNKSTMHYLIMYIDGVIKALENKGSAVCSVVTDFSKAYDNVDHNILINKLIDLDPTPGIIRWIVSFLMERVQIIKSPAHITTKPFTISNGVPQGTVLGGILFAVMINQLASNVEMRLKFVDDLTLSKVVKKDSDLIGFQKDIDMVSNESAALNLPLNPDKCVTIIHDFRKCKMNPVLRILGKDLPEVSSVKLLGIIIRSDLKWSNQVEYMIKKANRSMFVLYRLRRINSDVKILIMAYKVFVRSNLEYGIPVWSTSLTMIQIKQIESIQRRVVRLILGNQYLNYNVALKLLGLESLKQRRENILINFAKKFFSLYPKLAVPTQGEISGRTTRGSEKFRLPICKTKRYTTSPIVSMFRIINSIF